MKRSATLMACLFWVGGSPQGSETPVVESIKSFEVQFGISVVWKNPRFPIAVSGGNITGSDAGPSVQQYLSLMVREFSVYPKEFLQRSKLKRIVVCRDLAYADQKRAAIPDFAGRTLYLDCERGSQSLRYQRGVIHHEFFHLIDYVDDGAVYEDANWSALNPTGFHYGKGGAAVQKDPTQSMFRNPTAGFLTNYSVSGVEEDKAELFAHLILNAQKVEAAVASDEVLDSKVLHLKASLRQFCPQLDDAFWRRTAAKLTP